MSKMKRRCQVLYCAATSVALGVLSLLLAATVGDAKASDPRRDDSGPAACSLQLSGAVSASLHCLATYESGQVVDGGRVFTRVRIATPLDAAGGADVQLHISSGHEPRVGIQSTGSFMAVGSVSDRSGAEWRVIVPPTGGFALEFTSVKRTSVGGQGAYEIHGTATGQLWPANRLPAVGTVNLSATF